MSDKPKLAVDITGLFEVHLPVKDRSKSVEFYQDILGLTLARSSEERDYTFLWLAEPGNQMIGLWGPECQNPPVSKGFSHFAMKTSDNDMLGAFNALSQAGVETLGINGESISEPVVIGWMPAVSVYFKDPDGHSLEFIAMLDGEPRADLGVVSLSEWEKR